MTKISRRQFIAAALTSIASANMDCCRSAMVRLPPTATAIKRDLVTQTPPDPATTPLAEEADPVVKTITNFLRQELNYLKLDEADLVIFAREFQLRQGPEKLLDQYNKEPDKIEKRVLTQFLMSTDFFWNNADETKPVRYTTYYDPYNLCSNPFARFD
jgi:hypothetical protein